MTEIEFEVWQNGAMEAGGTTNDAMTTCPRRINQDMTEPSAQQRCRDTQRRGECEARRCMYSVPNKKKQKFLVAYNAKTW